MRKLFALLGIGFSLLSPTPAPAQLSRSLDPEVELLCWECYHHNEHFLLVGVVGNLVARTAPFLDESWRQESREAGDYVFYLRRLRRGRGRVPVPEGAGLRSPFGGLRGGGLGL